MLLHMDGRCPTRCHIADCPLWTHRLPKNIRTWGPKTLTDAIAEAEEKKITDKERRETVGREASYFRDHEEHMDYRTARATHNLS